MYYLIYTKTLKNQTVTVVYADFYKTPKKYYLQ